MTTERMTEAERSKIEEFVEVGHVLSDDQASALLVEVDRARRVEQEQAAEIALLKQSQAAQKHTIAELREQLRLSKEQAALANDKMAEQVRQARYDVAMEIYGAGGERAMNEVCSKIIDVNAPKD